MHVLVTSSLIHSRLSGSQLFTENLLCVVGVGKTCFQLKSLGSLRWLASLIIAIEIMVIDIR